MLRAALSLHLCLLPLTADAVCSSSKARSNQNQMLPAQRQSCSLACPCSWWLMPPQSMWLLDGSSILMMYSTKVDSWNSSAACQDVHCASRVCSGGNGEPSWNVQVRCCCQPQPGSTLLANVLLLLRGCCKFFFRFLQCS